eukprot:TRINITY_DN11466_c0_g1_i1.p1 TRINITY_DN11466_c0_g1~~TRINITY_DN11466_c0_g1_i1.p1  ORF type:complete len:474 (-),score=76.53 TRINITY_DN11466_c0_g1_i1:70-1440(-)
MSSPPSHEGEELETARANAQMVFISSEWPMTKTDYPLDEQIGAGMGLNKVWVASCPNRDRVRVAVKQIDLSDQSPASREKISKEVQGMSLVAHMPNIVKFFCSFVEDDLLWIVMELMEGSLRDVIKWRFPHGITDELLIASVVRETTKGLALLHHNTPKFIHRDVKAGNILFDASGRIKLADFGVSAVLQTHDERRTTMAGTWHWMAPEVIDPTDYGGYDERADIWSLGITAIELAYSAAPYSTFRPNQVVLFILQNPPPTLNSPSLDDSYLEGKKFTKGFHDFVKQCLQHHPKKRPSAAKLLRNRFFEKVPKDCAALLSDSLFSGLPDIGARFRQSQEEKKKMMLNDPGFAVNMNRKKPRKSSSRRDGDQLTQSNKPRSRKKDSDSVREAQSDVGRLKSTTSKKHRHDKVPCAVCGKTFSEDGMKTHSKICTPKVKAKKAKLEDSFSSSDEILDF